MNNHFKMHLSGGVRYIQYNDKVKLNFEEESSGGDGYFRYSEKIKYYGIGPRVLFNGTYTLNRYFDLIVGIGSSIILGDMDQSKFSTNFRINSEESGLTRKEKPVCQTVPEVDVNIGINFTKLIRNQASLSIETGWQSTHYFNITLQPHIFGISTISENKSTDFAISGPYLSIKLSA